MLLPVFASYKALRASDPAQLTPWLIYWIILSLILLVESWTVFILGWLPFYSWIRLLALSYLVLPQTQGAKLLYTNYVEPFIANHERQIETFIGDLHEKGSRAGLGYLKRLIDLIRERAFGLQPTRSEPQPTQGPTTAAGYAQSLLARFAMPSARTPTTSDFYSMLSGAVSAATSSSSTTTTTTTRSTSGTRSTTNPSNSSSNNPNPLIPTHLTNPTDKQTFLSAQREKLAVLTRALDREQRDLDLAYGNTPPGLEKQLEADVERRIREAGSGSGSGYDESSGHGGDAGGGGTGMRKNRSDNSFQNIEREEFEDEDEKSATPRSEGRQRQSAGAGRRTTSGGSWNPTTWFSGAGSGSGGDGSAPDEAAQAVRDAVQGISSSVDRRR